MRRRLSSAGREEFRDITADPADADRFLDGSIVQHEKGGAPSNVTHEPYDWPKVQGLNPKLRALGLGLKGFYGLGVSVFSLA